MASREIYADKSGLRLIAGLEWRILDANVSVEAGLRSVGSDRAATHAALSLATVTEAVQVRKKSKEIRRVAGGFFVAGDGEGPGKKGHSAAAAFAAWTAEHPKAALSIAVSNNKYLVIIVLNGLPVVDKILDGSTEAYQLVVGYLKDHADLSLFSDDIDKFPSTLLHEGLLEHIASACSKATLIRPIPVDVMKMAVIGVVVLALAAGYWYVQKQKAEEKRREAIARAQAEDPVPKYLSALIAQSGTLGVARQGLVDALKQALKVPLAPGGWNLKKIACSKDLACSAEYQRGTGTFESLVKAGEFLQMQVQSEAINLNEARMTWKQDLPYAGIEPGSELVNLGDFVHGPAGSVFQNWLVAGLGIQIQPPALWPQVVSVPNNFKHVRAVAVGRIEVAGLQLPLVDEVVLKAPSNVVWSGWSIEVGDPRQPADVRVKVRVLGNYYVKN